MELQTSKKQLAGVLLSPHDGEGTDDRLGVLHVGSSSASESFNGNVDANVLHRN